MKASNTVYRQDRYLNIKFILKLVHNSVSHQKDEMIYYTYGQSLLYLTSISSHPVGREILVYIKYKY